MVNRKQIDESCPKRMSQISKSKAGSRCHLDFIHAISDVYGDSIRGDRYWPMVFVNEKRRLQSFFETLGDGRRDSLLRT